MQIDFHYDMLYVLARYACFDRQDAEIIAHSSQYVDDAEHGGIIKFTNYPSYYHIRTAHKMLDRENWNATANFNTWVPFHFLPGNISDTGGDEEIAYLSKLVCKADSAIANEMMKECIRQKNEYNGLHRLGLSLHVYADTWAHQNFAGIADKLNQTTDIDVLYKVQLPQEILREFGNEVFNLFADDYLPLGHGSVQAYPDIPFIKWSYYDHAGVKLEIENYKRYIAAAQEIFKYLKRYQLGIPDAVVEELPIDVKSKLLDLLENIKGNRQQRHMLWQKKMDEDYFGFHDRACPYASNGQNSWKGIALSTDKADVNAVYTIDSSFYVSDWKRFHDAAKEHLNFVMNELLPKYEIVS